MRERKKSKSILKGAAFFLATFAFCGVIALGTKYINHTHNVTTTIETQVAYADGTAVIDKDTWNSFKDTYKEDIKNVTSVVTSLEVPQELGAINEPLGTNVYVTINGSVMTFYSTDGTKIYLPSDCFGFFYVDGYSGNEDNSFRNVNQMNLLNFDTSNVTNMMGMFVMCSSLTSLDLTNFDTSKVTNMLSMFYCCTSLTSVDVSSFDTSNVTSMMGIFGVCSSLYKLDLSSFDLSSINTDPERLIAQCNNLRKIYLPKTLCSYTNALDLDYNYHTEDYNYSGNNLTAFADTLSTQDHKVLIITDSVENQDPIINKYTWDSFKGSHQSDIQNVTKVVTSLSAPETLGSINELVGTKVRADINGTTMTIYSTNGDPIALPEDSSYLFNGFSSLTSIDFSNFDTSNVTNMSAMFRYCYALNALDLTNFDTHNVTNISEMFAYCNNLYELDLSTLDLSNVMYSNSAFSGCDSLRKIYLPRAVSYNYYIYLPYDYHTEDMDYSGWSLNEFRYTLSTQNNKVLIITNYVPSREAVIYQNSWNNFKSDYSSDLRNIKKVVTKKGYNSYNNHYELGENTYAYINGDILEIYTRLDKDIELPENCSYMFSGLSSAVEFDLSAFDFSKVTNMSYMYENCTALAEMDLSDFDFTNINVGGLLSGCTSLGKVVMPQALSEDYDVELPVTFVLESDHTQEGDSLADFAEYLSTDENKIAVVKQLDLEFTVSSERFGELDVPEGIVYFYGQEVTVDDNALTIGDKTITATAKEVDGYTIEFVEWEGITDGKVTASTVNAVFTSQLIEYTITIVVNGEEIEIEYDAETPEFALEAPLADYGMEFLGWTWEGQTEPVKNVVIALGSFGDKNYTANFGLATYTITINVDGKLETIEYTMQSDDIEINTPSSSGLTFDGWVDENGNKIDEAVVKSGSTGDRYYKATWKRSPTLKYVAIGVLAFAGVAVAVEVLVGSLVLHKKKKAQSTKTEE